MDESIPTCIASYKNTELRTTREAGFRPKETLETPSNTWVSGIASLMRRIDSMVSAAFLRSSAIPVEMGRASVSKKISLAGIPSSSVACLYARAAISNFLSAVRAMPSSSIVPITIPAPYCLARLTTLQKRSSPSS